MTFERLIAAGALALVAAGLWLGFAALGSPAHQRDLALDRAALQRLNRRAMATRERPLTLCETFRLASAGSDEEWLDDWPHPAGRACYRFEQRFRAETPELLTPGAPHAKR